jgi:hypothetical protein
LAKKYQRFQRAWDAQNRHATPTRISQRTAPSSRSPGDVSDRAYEEGERPKLAAKELGIEPDFDDPGPWPRSQK